MPGRLLVPRGRDLARDGDRHEAGRDDEHEAEVRGRAADPVPPRRSIARSMPSRSPKRRTRRPARPVRRRSPVTMSAAIQPTISPRVRRSVRPACPPSSTVRGLDVSRVASALAPRSRAAATRIAAATRTATRTTIGRKATGFEPVSGRSSSIQPSGLAHRSQPSPGSESAAIRTRYEPARIPAPIRFASRRVAASSATSMPIAMNIAVAARSEVAKNSDAPNPMFTFEEAPAPAVSTTVAQPDGDEPHAEPHRRLPGGPASRRPSGQEQLPPPGVLFAAERPRGDEEAPDGAEDDHGHPRLVDGVARHRVEPPERTEQRRPRGVALERQRDLGA